MMLYYYIFWSVPMDVRQNDVIHLQDSKDKMQQIQRYFMDIESQQKKIIKIRCLFCCSE